VRFQLASRAAALGVAFFGLVNAGVYDRTDVAFVAAIIIFLVFAVPMRPRRKEPDPYLKSQAPEGWKETS
jgi:hypothetical protein